MRISAKLNRNMNAAFAAIWLSLATGCASLETPSLPEMPSLPSIPAVGKVFDKQEPISEPNSVAVVWTTAVMEKEASRPTRGFGGMVTFYGEDKKKPVRVDGQFTIYAYENLSHEHDDSTPDRKYIFKPEQMQTHYGEGPLGPSYSIWIPWDSMKRIRSARVKSSDGLSRNRMSGLGLSTTASFMMLNFLFTEGGTKVRIFLIFGLLYPNSK